MSGRSTGSGSSSRASGDYKEIRLPNSRSVKALIYFCGRDPRKAKSVRRYYDEDFDTRSTGSGGSGSSMFSWSSAASQVYLVESTAPYWYIEEPASVSYSSPPRKHKSSKKGRTSRASQHNAPPVAAGTWGRQPRVDDEDDDDDYDDSSSDGSADDYGGQNPGPYPHPHPPMHPGMHPGMPHGMPPQQGPPPGAFQPMYGYPQHGTPHPMPPAGYPMPPPPQPTPGGMPPPPPPPGGHFVPGRGGVQVFVDG